MYLAIVKGKFASFFRKVFSRDFVRSGMLPGILLGVLVIVLGVVYRERGKGHLHKLETKIGTDTPVYIPPPRPGGQDPLIVTRTGTVGGSVPEFLSASFLPGRGMNAFQITAYLPGKGEVSLMASPSVAQAASAMTGKDADAYGLASLQMGGAFELPWVGRVTGLPSQSDGRLNTIWHQHLLSLPSMPDAAAESIDGMMLATGADTAVATPAKDGGQARAVFHAADFGAHWPSDTDVTITAVLTGRSIELDVQAKNVGDSAEPIGIGWLPRFAMLGARDQISLRLPEALHAEVRDRSLGLPTGKLEPVAGTPFDFTRRQGTLLGDTVLDDLFVQLHQDMMENGPVVEIRDPASNYGIRMTLLSPTIKALHVLSPEGANFIAVGPRFNYDDPYGKQWPMGVDTGMVTLQPGEQTQWKVRLELFSLGAQKQETN